MRPKIQNYLTLCAAVLLLSSFMAVKDKFTNAETQQISISTPGLFSRSNAFTVDFNSIAEKDYSFPLPVGKATVMKNSELEISSSKGDAVKAMFSGVVRLSKKNALYGNVIVIRHDNGFETVYGNNAQNLVKVGDHVKAGQTVAIIGSKDGKTYCRFAIMVNGGKVNPEILIDNKSHRLRKQVFMCQKTGTNVSVSVDKSSTGTNKGELAAKPAQAERPTNVDYTSNAIVSKLNLANLDKSEWCYPLPGSHVISPYGGRRNHSGVDIKTKPNDNIYAAFDGVVTRSGKYYGYGNCIEIKHANGLKTLYGHESKLVVKVGDVVKAGQLIGLTGRTGRATTEHLHFEVFFDGKRINPSLVFDEANRSLRQNTLTYNRGVVRSQKNYYAQGK